MRSWKCCSTWLAPLLVPICRLMVVLSMGGWIWALGSYKCLLVPYALMPAWLAHLLVPIWKGKRSPSGITETGRGWPAADSFVLLNSPHLRESETKMSSNMFRRRISHYCQAPTPTSSTTLLSLYWRLDLRNGTVAGLTKRTKTKPIGEKQWWSGGWRRSNTWHRLTCRPMTHCPAFIFSSSNDLSCLSAYFTPMSTCVWQPLVLAWPNKGRIFQKVHATPLSVTADSTFFKD